MPLMIHYNGPYAAPKCFCDHCGQEITEAADGNSQWLTLDEAGTFQDTAPICFTHKRCCNAFEKARGGSWSAIGLECLPYYLTKNLKVTWRQAQASGRLMADLA